MPQPEPDIGSHPVLRWNLGRGKPPDSHVAVRHADLSAARPVGGPYGLQLTIAQLLR